jgi:hypothetical protein
MKFDIDKKDNKNENKYLDEDVELARKFTRLVYKEFGGFISRCGS